jgi:penicillin G amidase
MDVIGATLPGTPFVVLGRTEGVAWGFTNTGPDVQDLYLEQIDPAMPALPCRRPTRRPGPRSSVREETIRVKGEPDVVHTVRSTRHGPCSAMCPAARGH